MINDSIESVENRLQIEKDIDVIKNDPRNREGSQNIQKRIIVSRGTVQSPPSGLIFESGTFLDRNRTDLRNRNIVFRNQTAIMMSAATVNAAI